MKYRSIETRLGLIVALSVTMSGSAGAQGNAAVYAHKASHKPLLAYHRQDKTIACGAKCGSRRQLHPAAHNAAPSGPQGGFDPGAAATAPIGPMPSTY